MVVPARKKKLHDFVRDRTFLARRHAHLLLTEQPIWGRELRALQERYQGESDAYARRRIALQFQRLVRETDEERLDRLIEQALDELPVVLLPERRGRPRKSLLELIESGGFKPDRHAHLLEGELLPAESPFADGEQQWQALRDLQLAFQQDDPSVAFSPATIRLLIAQRFRDLIRELHQAHAGDRESN